MRTIFVLLLAFPTVLAACDGDGAMDTPATQRGPLGKADAPGSCASGPDSCGQQSPDGCYCDDLCQEYDDCCSDYASVCACVPLDCEDTEPSCGWVEDGCGGYLDCGLCFDWNGLWRISDADRGIVDQLVIYEDGTCEAKRRYRGSYGIWTTEAFERCTYELSYDPAYPNRGQLTVSDDGYVEAVFNFVFTDENNIELWSIPNPSDLRTLIRDTQCEPRSCTDVTGACGPVQDGCGQLLACDPCDESDLLPAGELTLEGIATLPIDRIETGPAHICGSWGLSTEPFANGSIDVRVEVRGTVDHGLQARISHVTPLIPTPSFWHEAYLLDTEQEPFWFGWLNNQVRGTFVSRLHNGTVHPTREAHITDYSFRVEGAAGSCQIEYRFEGDAPLTLRAAP